MINPMELGSSQPPFMRRSRDWLSRFQWESGSLVISYQLSVIREREIISSGSCSVRGGSPQKEAAFSIIEFNLENAFGQGSSLLIDDQFPEAARMLQLAHRVGLFLVSLFSLICVIAL
jgi:hypothetical protein